MVSKRIQDAFEVVLETGLVSQMLTIPSSETLMKCVNFPSLGALLSTLTVGGTKTMSPTKFLCEAMMLD